MGHFSAMSTTPDPVAPSVVPTDPDAGAPDDALATDPSAAAADPSAAATDVRAPRRRHLVALLTTLTVAVLLVDQLTKAWAIDALASGDRVDVIGDLLGLRLLFNPGAALSIATGMTWLLTLVALGVVVVIVRSARRLGSTAWAVALGLLLGGALGNLWDRMLREPGFARGHVVDFIAYGDLFVGNVADVAIVVAAGMIMVLAATGVHLDGTRERHAPADTAAEAEPEAISAEVTDAEAVDADAEADAGDAVPADAPGTDAVPADAVPAEAAPADAEEPDAAAKAKPKTRTPSTTGKARTPGTGGKPRTPSKTGKARGGA